MSRFDLVPLLLVAALVSSVPASAQDYCATNKDSPECYCQDKDHSSELKCLRFFGSNPGFSSKGVGTSATFNSQTAPPPVQQSSPVVDRSLYNLFIHYGTPSGMTGLPNVSSLIQIFKEDGYIVRGADTQTDPSGTSGIDYFRQEDKDGAQVIADTVNKWLKENGKDLAMVKPRRQEVRNPPGYIGVWIFGRGTKP